MRLVSIQMKNIKSHRDTSLTFAPGINVLSGANGSGKSTVFQAIGYALFGVSAQDFVSRAERFLSIGAKRGEISVVFEPADGERYRVTRSVGPSAKWLLARESDGAFEIEEHANIEETQTRIASLLGLSLGRSLADQFKLVIGPFQNDFLGPFVIRQPTKRQDAFDEILGIDAWRKTFDGTKSLASAILAKIETLQAEAAGKEEQVAVLPAKELELAGLAESSAAKTAELAREEGALRRVTALLAELDGQKQRVETVQNEVQTLEERSVAGNSYVATQKQLVEQSKGAAAVLTAAGPGKNGYDAAESRLKALRLEDEQRQIQERRLAELDRERSSISATLAGENRELSELAASLAADGARLEGEEQVLAAGLAELKTQEDEAGRTLALVRDAAARFRELPSQRIEQVTPYLMTALDRMAAIDAQSAERRRIIEGSGTLRAEADRLGLRQTELERVQSERSELSGRRLSLVEGREKIGAGDCPFFHEPCKNLQGGSGVEQFGSRIEQLDAEMGRLEAQASALAAEVSSAQTATRELAVVEAERLELEKGSREREALEQEFDRNLSDIAPATLIRALDGWLPGSGTTAGLPLDRHDLELAAGGSPQERRDRLLAWSDAWHRLSGSLERGLAERLREAEEPVRLSALKLAELSAKGEALFVRKGELASGRERLSQRKLSIAAHLMRLEAVERGIATESAALAVHAGLEEAVRTAGEELERFQKDRDAYIANQKAAEELDQRLDTLAKYETRLQALTAELAAKRDELAGLQTIYQASEHQDARTKQGLLVSAIATLKADLANLDKDIARLTGEIAALTLIAGEIALKIAEIERLKEQGELVKFLRSQVFKNVSSQLSERFREEISFRADRIYRSIAESDEELFWGENYQVVLKDMSDGVIRERTDDQLSGGQMMSAVVALRLALLQTIGARIAFFDEPTSNLDQERRENLARAFRAIDVGQEEVTEHWYDQLFLVSHDVSFTEITDQTIQLD